MGNLRAERSPRSSQGTAREVTYAQRLRRRRPHGVRPSSLPAVTGVHSAVAMGVHSAAAMGVHLAAAMGLN
eukprot:scaffold54296_cov26-Tisochrysis_lutea.AAC.1